MAGKHLSPELTRSVLHAAEALVARRSDDGYWEGRLASSPLATAIALCALSDESGDNAVKLAAGFTYLAHSQNSDGGWGDTRGTKSPLAATLLVLCADALCHALPPLQRSKAEDFADKFGGLHQGLRRVYGDDLTFQAPIRMAAASAGLLPWRLVDQLPLELALAPRGMMGALGLPVVSYALPALVCVGLARHRRAPTWFLPRRWLRSAAAGFALRLIRRMQPDSGGYLEAVPITSFCLLALRSAGCGDHTVAQHARKFVLATQRPDGGWPVEVHLSVWNTTRAIDALAAAHMLDTALDATGRARTRDWLLAQQTRAPSVYSNAPAGGWGWNHLSGSVPDADDTAGALIALRHLGIAADDPTLQRGATWLLGLQNADGGFPTFCRGWGKLPFDRSAADLTAHALRALTPLWSSPRADGGVASPPPPLAGGGRGRAAWDYLRAVQRSDGSFAPLWFGCQEAADEANCTYGTANVLLACTHDAAAADMSERALAWLRGVQNADGGFGGCKGAHSTAEETGLALRALLAAGVKPTEDACLRAAHWLMDRQRPDGSWDPAPIGFYFAVLWYHEELYPLCYALGGLGALAQALR